MHIKILIVDDHEVVRQGLHSVLKARPEWEIIGEAENGQEAVQAVAEKKPDVVILDITMPVMSGLEATQEICALNLGTRVLIFTMHDSKSLVKAVRKAGASGYVLKSHASRDLIRAIEALFTGGSFFGSDVGDKIQDENTSKDRNLLLRMSFLPT
jgi:two-component system nitrate/nitrite response regulator NarL